MFDTSETIQPDRALSPEKKTLPLFFSDEQAPSISNQLMREVSCLIAFYVDRDDLDQINVDVNITNLKLSINCQISKSDIFSKEISQHAQAQVIDEVISKLFIYCQDGTYELKIQNKSKPIKTYLKEKYESERGKRDLEMMKVQEERKETQRKRQRMMTNLSTDESWKEKAKKIEKYHVVDNYIFKVSAMFLSEMNDTGIADSPKRKNRRSNQLGGKSFKTRKFTSVPPQENTKKNLNGMIYS